ncbi:MAG: DoxX family membrane protein [Candidatus Puniceispirillales bacterium]
MTMIARLAEHYITASRQLDRISSEALPIIARLIFGITLVAFFWRSGLTKLGDGLAGFVIPSAGAYAQILPRKFEAAGYDTAAMGALDWLVVMAGTYGEFILPLLIILGLATRLAAAGMIGFIIVMSIVDVTGHGVSVGGLLDGNPGSIIPDQRLYWTVPLLILLFRGGGTLSLDHVICLIVKPKSFNNKL